MPPNTAEVRRWLVKARNDWSAAQKIFFSANPELDVAAFHCQQAAEKTLKSYLVLRQVGFEKIHDLRRILDLCADIDEQFNSLRDAAEPLTIFAVVFRYPGPAEPTTDHVTKALQCVPHERKISRSRRHQ